jgi:simple sugar transport system ATP-binding protein
MTALLEMRGISKAYGSVQANAGIDLTVTAGRLSACSARTARAKAP